MIRTHIWLPKQQKSRLEAKAKAKGISFSEIVRRLLDAAEAKEKK